MAGFIKPTVAGITALSTAIASGSAALYLQDNLVGHPATKNTFAKGANFLASYVFAHFYTSVPNTQITTTIALTMHAAN